MGEEEKRVFLQDRRGTVRSRRADEGFGFWQSLLSEDFQKRGFPKDHLPSSMLASKHVTVDIFIKGSVSKDQH